MKLTGAQILWEALVREGVADVFGYPGGAILPAYDAMLQYPIRHVLVRHEQGATHMADGYARASGKVGVAIATSGPGATNMVTGIATAMMDSSPIVCITGQVGSKLIGSDAFQETDITGITLPITKHNYLVTSADEVAHAVREAFAVALVIAAIACVVNALSFRRSRILIGAIALPVVVYLIAAVFIPSYVTNFIVKPNEIGRETPYIEQNITWTRRAFGIDKIEQRNFEAEPSVESFGLQDNRATLENIRLWDWRALQDTLKQMQAIRIYYDFPDVDVDRYQTGGQTRQRAGVRKTKRLGIESMKRIAVMSLLVAGVGLLVIDRVSLRSKLREIDESEAQLIQYGRPDRNGHVRQTWWPDQRPVRQLGQWLRTALRAEQFRGRARDLGGAGCVQAKCSSRTGCYFPVGERRGAVRRL